MLVLRELLWGDWYQLLPGLDLEKTARMRWSQRLTRERVRVTEMVP